MDIDLELFCVKVYQREVRRTVATLALVQQARSRPPSRRTGQVMTGLRHVLRACSRWTRVFLQEPDAMTK